MPWSRAVRCVTARAHTGDFFAGDFFASDFFAGDFFAAVFFAVGFFPPAIAIFLLATDGSVASMSTAQTGQSAILA